MDITKQNILRCQKATEIQKLKPDASDSSGQFFICEICGNTYIEDDGINWCQNHINESKNPIWIPYQGQLQRILWFPMTASDMYGWLRKITEFQMKHSCQSMEQLWLAFVMSEKYSKQWDNNKEEWSETRIP